MQLIYRSYFLLRPAPIMETQASKLRMVWCEEDSPRPRIEASVARLCVHGAWQRFPSYSELPLTLVLLSDSSGLLLPFVFQEVFLFYFSLLFHSWLRNRYTSSKNIMSLQFLIISLGRLISFAAVMQLRAFDRGSLTLNLLDARIHEGKMGLQRT